MAVLLPLCRRSPGLGLSVATTRTLNLYMPAVFGRYLAQHMVTVGAALAKRHGDQEHTLQLTGGSV